MSRPYTVYSDFDLQLHKKTFVNYLEVILFPDGHIEYAVPSHQEKLIGILSRQLGISREQVWTLIPVNADVMEYLTDKTQCIAIWTKFHIGKPVSESQAYMLELLIRKGLTSYHL